MSTDINDLIRTLARLPGIGPRSARRLSLKLLQDRENLLAPLIQQLNGAYTDIKTCDVCGNFDNQSPCTLCTNHRRNRSVICVVESVGDIWAIERTRSFDGLYHVLGGVLSAIDGVRPEDLNINTLLTRIAEEGTTEIVLALAATVDGQTTAHYLADRLNDFDIRITKLAHGMPVGGELDYIDDGTLSTALRSRTTIAR